MVSTHQTWLQYQLSQLSYLVQGQNAQNIKMKGFDALNDVEW
jgi:hypothetical protein